MTVTEAVATRRSVRAFLPTAVPADLIRRVLEKARRAPSGGNLQPWHVDVLGGEALTAFKAQIEARVTGPGPAETPDYDIYPKELPAPYRDYRYAIGEALYRELGIPREDKPGRLRQFFNNYRFFGAPLALFCSVDRGMGPPQWSDLGMFLQTLMLLLREEGLDSCAQESWSVYPKTVGALLGLPPERMLFCGMAIGYADPDAAANRLRSERAPLETFAHFHGI